MRPVTDCPRRILTAKGKTRVVRCRLWSCPTCAETKRAQIISAARRTFTGGGVSVLLLRAQQDGHHDDLVHVWARLRSRFPGMRYIAVREPSPDAHLHALVTNVYGEGLKVAALSCGAFECNVDFVRSVPAYINYLLEKRQDRQAVRITHSRDLTSSLSRDGDHRKDDHDRETNPPGQVKSAHEAPAETFTSREGFTHRTSETQPEASRSVTFPAPAIVADDAGHVRQRNELETLIEAARAIAHTTGNSITFTITINP